jgi:hypothetical protein
VTRPAAASAAGPGIPVLSGNGSFYFGGRAVAVSSRMTDGGAPDARLRLAKSLSFVRMAELFRLA